MEELDKHIRKVTYERLVNIGRYENFRVVVEADVADKDPHEVMRHVMKFVETKCDRQHKALRD